MRIKTYLKLFSISWQAGLVYRASVFLWRSRALLSTVMSLAVWNALFGSQAGILGYNRAEMTTYIFLVSILQSLIIATDLHNLAYLIYNGDIANQLLKPINLYATLFSYDMADKIKNFFFVVCESALLALFFKPAFIVPNAATLLLVITWTLLAVILNFIITLLFGCIGFWSNEAWAPKFLFFIAIDFTAGKLFPLDILPEAVQRILMLTPFPYLSYLQTQLFLGKTAPTLALQQTLALIGWCVGLGIVLHRVWSRGMRSYEAVGR